MTNYTITLVPYTCGNCGVVFGMESQHLQRLKGENGNFFLGRVDLSEMFVGLP